MQGQTRKSKTVEKNLNPTWHEDMTVRVADRMEPLKIEVFDEDVHDDDDSMVFMCVCVCLCSV